jgi:hypothetical protein
MWPGLEGCTTIKTTIKNTNIITRFDHHPDSETVAEAERISTIGGSLGSIGTISQVSNFKRR